MKVTITPRGGFVGGEVPLVQVDTARLDGDAKREVEGRIADTVARKAAGDRPVGADLLEYTLVLDDQGRHDAITWVDDGGPSTAPIRDLITRLQQLQ